MIQISTIILACLGHIPWSAAQPLDLRVGSTRDWVKRTGPSGDSVRYHLEFLKDSTTRILTLDSAFLFQTQSTGGWKSAVVETGEWIVDWKVRITSPDSPMVSDTAILRVHDASMNSEDLEFPARSLINSTYWLRPSPHFPIDLLQNSTEDEWNIQVFSEGIRNQKAVVTGAIELSLLLDRWLNDFDRGSNDLCYAQLYESMCGAVPLASSRGDTGIVAWLANGAFWELVAYDGVPRSLARHAPEPPLRKGMTWIFRDSLLRTGPTAKNPPALGFVDLTVLDLASDTSGWIRLDLLMTHRSDTGKDSSRIVSVGIHPKGLRVRVDSVDLTAWSLGSPKLPFVGIWALGLLPPPDHSPEPTTSYRYFHGWTDGESDPTFGKFLCELSRSSEAGTKSIRHFEADGFAWGGRFIGDTTLHSWTLVAHAQDSSILSATPRTRVAVRDLAWLRARLAADPTLEVVRIGLDGTRSLARGNAGLALLERRGVGILQLRDEGRMVVLRVVHP